jgi:formylglycine-generating enzyme required for sulfatase activity
MAAFFKKLRCDNPTDKVDIFVQVLNEDAGLLVARGDDAYAFPHLTFQEYLTACGLTDRQDMVPEAYRAWSGSDASRWREVLLLMMGKMRQLPSLSVEQYAVAWLDRLLAKNIGQRPKPAVQRWQDSALAALSYRELGGQTTLASTQIDIEPRILTPLRTAIVDMLATPDSGVVLADRLAAARLLAELGDPRLLDPTSGNSPIGDYWCHVEPGAFWFGEDDSKQKLRQMHLPYDFQTARYLVTNAEYARFMQAGGYQEQQWWTERGWKWKWKKKQRLTRPFSLRTDGFNHPAQPVRCSWFEAAAYCKWLTAQGHAQGWLPAQEVIRLPTSREWERAARHTDQRCYPWGDDPITAAHANAKETGIGTPTPVGCFPRGAAHCGAQDMLGNMWEWTATHDKQDDEPQPRDDFAPDDVVRLRGAAYYVNIERVFCGSRDRSVANGRGSLGGVRLLRPLAHPNNSSDF